MGLTIPSQILLRQLYNECNLESVLLTTGALSATLIDGFIVADFLDLEKIDVFPYQLMEIDGFLGAHRTHAETELLEWFSSLRYYTVLLSRGWLEKNLSAMLTKYQFFGIAQGSK